MSLAPASGRMRVTKTFGFAAMVRNSCFLVRVTSTFVRERCSTPLSISPAAKRRNCFCDGPVLAEPAGVGVRAHGDLAADKANRAKAEYSAKPVRFAGAMIITLM